MVRYRTSSERPFKWSQHPWIEVRPLPGSIPVFSLTPGCSACGRPSLKLRTAQPSHPGLRLFACLPACVSNLLPDWLRRLGRRFGIGAREWWFCSQSGDTLEAGPRGTLGRRVFGMRVQSVTRLATAAWLMGGCCLGGVSNLLPDWLHPSGQSFRSPNLSAEAQRAKGEGQDPIEG